MDRLRGSGETELCERYVQSGSGSRLPGDEFFTGPYHRPNRMNDREKCEEGTVTARVIGQTAGNSAQQADGQSSSHAPFVCDLLLASSRPKRTTYQHGSMNSRCHRIRCSRSVVSVVPHRRPSTSHSPVTPHFTSTVSVDACGSSGRRMLRLVVSHSASAGRIQFRLDTLTSTHTEHH